MEDWNCFRMKIEAMKFHALVKIYYQLLKIHFGERQSVLGCHGNETHVADNGCVLLRLLVLKGVKLVLEILPVVYYRTGRRYIIKFWCNMGDEVKNKHVYLCIQCGYSADALIRKYSKSTLTLQSCVSSKILEAFRIVCSILAIDITCWPSIWKLLLALTFSEKPLICQHVFFWIASSFEIHI